MNEQTTVNQTEEMPTAELETQEIIEVETFDPENSNWENMIDTLPLMGKGMLGIFLVTILIVAAVAILNKTTNRRPKEE